MTRWIAGLAVVGAVVGGGAAAIAVAGAAWNRETERLVERLERLPSGGGPHVYSPAELEGLPEPVARYFDRVLTPGQPLVHRARVEHRGEFRTSPDADWSPFRSQQHVTVNRPGFVWDARIRMVPLLDVRVRDSYVDGRAGMLGRLAGLVTVVREQGTPHLASGALHRYLLESAWIPTALLPSQGVRWEPIDDRSARATLSDAGISVSIDVHFAERGEIERVEARRMRDVEGAGVPTPTVGEFRDYREVDGMRVPTQGEIAWILPDHGRFAYWRARADHVEYDFAR